MDAQACALPGTPQRATHSIEVERGLRFLVNDGLCIRSRLIGACSSGDEVF